MKPKSPAKTHFICLPLRTVAFRNRVAAFNALLPSTIHPSIIRPTGSLHFTLGVMSLVTAEEIESAVQFLKTCRADALSVLQGHKLTVNLKGIASMQANLKKTNVIYAVPENGDGRLRTLCNLLQSKFKEANFLKNDRHSGQEVKLHCTLLNTLHMRPRPRNRNGAVVDAEELLASEELGAYDFGEVDIEEVQICEMGVKEVDGEVRYKSVGGFSLVSGEETRDVVVDGLNEIDSTAAEPIEVDVLVKDVTRDLEKG